jgi:hypothetical protein
MGAFYKLVVASMLFSSSAFAAPSTMQYTIKDNFNSLFLTAAYSTAMGAALGAAALGFQKEPKKNLRFIPLGASIGFITGTLLGTYFIFVPSFGGKGSNYDDLEGFSKRQEDAPVDLSSLRFKDLGWEATWTLARF